MALVYFFGYYAYLDDIAWGCALSLVIIWATVIATERLIGRSVPLLLGLVVGGFLLRLIIVLISGLYVNFRTELHLFSYYCGLIGSYFLLQTLEIIYLHKRLTQLKQSAHEVNE
ncbi:hypothetical protein ACFL6L_03485 [candidate division KSB1 bacterium]